MTINKTLNTDDITFNWFDLEMILLMTLNKNIYFI